MGRCQHGSLDKWLLVCVSEMVPHGPHVTMAVHQTEEESWRGTSGCLQALYVFE